MAGTSQPVHQANAKAIGDGNGNGDGNGDGDAASPQLLLWDALRALSDDEREAIERVLVRFHTASASSRERVEVLVRHTRDSTSRESESNQANAGLARQQWAPDAFVHALLGQLHALVHEPSGGASSREEPTPESPALAPSPLSKPSTASVPASGATPFKLEADDFPSLGGSSRRGGGGGGAAAGGEGGNTRNGAKTTTKRRITTTLVTGGSAYTPVAVTSQRPLSGAFSTQGMGGGAPTEAGNPWASRDLLLEQRMINGTQNRKKPAALVKRAPLTTTTTAEDPANKSVATRRATAEVRATTLVPRSKEASKGHALRISPVMNEPHDNNESSRPQLEAITSTASEPMAVKTGEEKKSIAPLVPNLQAAKLYGFLIVNRLVPNTCAALRLLVGLLFRTSCKASVNEDGGCASNNEFCSSDVATAFAAMALETSEPVITQLGADMLQLIAKTLDELMLCGGLPSRLRDTVQAREDKRVEESAKIGCHLPIETKVTALKDYALPFCEETDSRLHYRTPAESVMYSNREKIRDAFLGQLRTFQKNQNSLAEGDAAKTASAEHARELLSDLVLPENMWWFARFFVQELIQIGSNPLGEVDNDLVKKIMEDKMVVKHPERLRKLHRRFSSQQGNGASLMSRGSGGTGERGHGGSKLGSTKPAKSDASSSRRTTSMSVNGATNHKQAAPVSSISTFDRMRPYFSENQVFFFHFLESCDSYVFAQLVKHHLHAQFLSIWGEKNKADPRKEFMETVLRLKVLAKFIGYLRFSPQWHMPSLPKLSVQNAALEAAHKEAVLTMETPGTAAQGRKGCSAVDVLALLEDSIRGDKIAKCIPWLCDYLTMLSSDTVSAATQYFQHTFLLLDRLHRSPRLQKLGETGLYVALQIEKLFHIVAVDNIIKPVNRWGRTYLPSDIVLALETGTDERGHNEGSDKTLDHLPFLYSKLFVQVCVSDLDDLRGFIQTRAKRPISHGTHRRSLTIATGERVPMIRKVRPLQVVKANSSSLSSNIFDPPSDSTPLQSTASVSVPAEVAPLGSAAGTRSQDDGATNSDILVDALFKVHPQLKRAVEFVVEMVVTTICEYILTAYVTPRVESLVGSSLAEARIATAPFPQLILHEFQSRVDRDTIPFMGSMIQAAQREAMQLCEERVESAMRPLVAPSIPDALLATATRIAKMQAQTALGSLLATRLRTEFTKNLGSRKRAIVKEEATTVAAAAVIAAATVAAPSVNTGAVDGHITIRNSVRAMQKSAMECAHSTRCLTHLELSDGRMTDFERSVINFCEALRAYAGSTATTPNQARHEEPVFQYDVLVWSMTWRMLKSSLRVFATICSSAPRIKCPDSTKVSFDPEDFECGAAHPIKSFLAVFKMFLNVASTMCKCDKGPAHRDTSGKSNVDEDLNGNTDHGGANRHGCSVIAIEREVRRCALLIPAQDMDNIGSARHMFIEAQCFQLLGCIGDTTVREDTSI